MDIETKNNSQSRVLEFREHFRKNIIPQNYSGVFHLFFCIFCLSLCLILSLYFMKGASWYHWALLPIFALIGNLVAYIIHKYPLHTPHPLSKNAYQIHTKWHHHFFTHELTTYDSSRDFFILFFPKWFAAGFTFIAIPILYFTTNFFLGPHFAAVACLGSTLYYIAYEVTHYTSHLPYDHWLLIKIPHFANMKRFHTIHHNHKLMHSYNFNIVFPFFDKIFRTEYKKD